MQVALGNGGGRLQTHQCVYLAWWSVHFTSSSMVVSPLHINHSSGTFHGSRCCAHAHCRSSCARQVRHAQPARILHHAQFAAISSLVLVFKYVSWFILFQHLVNCNIGKFLMRTTCGASQHVSCFTLFCVLCCFTMG